MRHVLSAKVIFYGLLLLVMDMCLVPRMGLGPLRPVLLYLLVPYAAFRWHWTKALPAALVAGILRDLVTSQPLGLETASLAAASLLLMPVVQKTERGFLPVRMLVAFLFVFAVSALQLVLAAVLDVTPSGMGIVAVITVLFGTAFASAVMVPVFFPVTEMWFGDAGRGRQYELFS